MASLTPHRNRITTPVTPKIADLIHTEVRLINRDDLSSKVNFGTAHEDTTRFPNHKVGLVRPNNAEGATKDSYLVTYVADRENQDDYNFEHVVADIGDAKYNLVRRSYVTPRSSYNSTSPAMGATMANTPAGMFSGTFVLAGRQESRIGDETLDSLYVAEVRTYIDRATLSESNFSPSSGISTIRSFNLYYRGEEIDGTPIEDLVADPSNAYWDGDGGDVLKREFQAVSENWFLVTEISVELPEDPKLSRIFDKSANVWINLTETPVAPGTIIGTLVGDTLTETKAGDYLQSQEEIKNPDLPGVATTSYEFAGPYDAIIATTKQSVTKGSASPGSGVEIDGSDVQWDERIAQAVISYGTSTISYDWDHTLNLPIKITKTLVAKGSAAASAGDGYYIEVQNFNHLIDIKLLVELEGTPENQTIPSVFPYQFPPILKAARFVGVSCFARSESDFAYDKSFYFETEIDDPGSKLVVGSLERIFVTSSGVESAVTDNSPHDWKAKAHSFGIVNAVAWVTNSRCTANADATQFHIPATVHDAIDISTASIGAGVPQGATEHTNKIILPATVGFGAWPETIVIDVDVIPHRFGWYEVQVKKISTSEFSGGATTASRPFTPIGGTGSTSNSTGVNAGLGGSNFGGGGGYNKWTSDPNAATYDFQIDDDPAFGSPVVSVTGLSSPSYDWTSVVAGTTYYARSRAVNSTGTSEWSSPWVIFNPATVLSTAPTLTSPANAATGVGLPPTVKWTVNSGVSYRLQLSTSSSYLDPAINVLIAAGGTGIYNEWLQDEAVYQFRASTTYYWRLRAETNLGYSAWTSRSFTTGTGLSAVTNLAVGDATEEGYPVTWDATSIGADSYTVYLVDSDGTTVLETYTGVTDTEFTIPIEDVDFGSYYARVGGALGGLTMATEQTSFTVTLPQPEITNLEDGDDVGPTFEITWGEVADAEDYQVVVKLGGSTIISEVVTDTSYATVTELTPGSTYTVRVIARANSGAVTSVDTDFVTVDVVASTPTITSPSADYERFVGEMRFSSPSIFIDLVLEWSEAANAIQYRYQLATDSGFTSLTYDDLTIQTSVTLENVNPDTIYYARVRVELRAGAGSSSWSSTRILETTSVPPDSISPASGGTTSDTTPDLSWAAVAVADDYEIQVSTRSDYATIAATGTVASPTTTWTVTPALAAGVRYHWRVRALKDASAPWAAGIGPWGGDVVGGEPIVLPVYFDVLP